VRISYRVQGSSPAEGLVVVALPDGIEVDKAASPDIIEGKRLLWWLTTGNRKTWRFRFDFRSQKLAPG